MTLLSRKPPKEIDVAQAPQLRETCAYQRISGKPPNKLGVARGSLKLALCVMETCLREDKNLAGTLLKRTSCKPPKKIDVAWARPLREPCA